MDTHDGPFEPQRAGFSFGPARDGTDLRRRAWIVVRMSLIVAVLAATTAASLYGLGYLVKLQLDRVLLTG